MSETPEWHEVQTQNVPDESEKVLGGITSNAVMAKHSTKTVLHYVKDEKLKDLLESQVARYGDFIERANALAKEHDVKIKEPSGVSKFFVETSIKMKLAVSADNGKIAEMMIKGTTMGIIDLGKLLKHSRLVKEDCLALAKELLTFEEDKVHALKYFL